MKILVYGAGVLGCNLARNLFRAGKDVTLLARGNWAEEIRQKGLRIKDKFSLRTSVSRISVVTELAPEARYDVICVVLRYTQLDSVLDTLKANRTKNIVFVGNNVQTRALAAALPEKNVLFAFALSAGHRESDQVVSIDLKKIIIGQLTDAASNKQLIGGKSDCGVLSYASADADHADKVVAITDCLVPFPNFPAQISMTKVDYVVAVDEIGNPDKIATGAAKPTTDMRKLMMADYCTQFVVNTPYFKDGFSYQTGVGGASIASTISLAKIMKERNIRMRFGVGGLTKPMCDLLQNDQVDVLLDTQDFDLAAVESVKDPRHFPISAGEYANPFNKGAVVNKLDFVILAALEVDVHFNCNVVVGSDGMLTGAQGGHPDTAAGAKCAIVIAPLLQGRIPAICTDVTTVTTPGETVDVVVTDYGIAINPRRQDLVEAMKDVDLPFKTIEELRDIAYSITGEPQKVEFGDRVVGIIESRDGTIMDVVREVKPFEFRSKE